MKSFFKALRRKYFVSYGIFGTTYLIETVQILFCLWTVFWREGGCKGKKSFEIRFTTFMSGEFYYIFAVFQMFFFINSSFLSSIDIKNNQKFPKIEKQSLFHFKNIKK